MGDQYYWILKTRHCADDIALMSWRKESYLSASEETARRNQVRTFLSNGYSTLRKRESSGAREKNP